MQSLNTLNLLLKLWPLLCAIAMGAFWMGILEFRVRANTAASKENTKQLERQREKQQQMEVDQAGWRSTLERIDAAIESINKKLDRRE